MDRRGLRVLIVDDNVPAAEGLAMVVELWGHEARAVFHGADAIDQVPRFRPDVVLLDIGLPVRDGHAVARDLRALPGGRGMLLVAITGYDREEDVRRSRESGFDDHLIKPLDLDRLEAILADAGPARGCHPPGAIGEAGPGKGGPAR